MASFDAVNYALRPNKNIERKLIADVLLRLEQQFPIRDYSYVGMGSLWFEDFRLLHRIFGWTEMTSIENAAPDRANYNRPYDCVTVEPGDTTLVLPDLPLRDRPSVIWLDHDKALARSVLEDIEIVMQTVPPGSVALVTVNASSGHLKGRDDESVEDAFRADVGPLVPPNLDQNAFTRRGFPRTVSTVLISAFRHYLSSAGRAEQFSLLYNFEYRDGAPMITVGGMVASEENAKALGAISWGHSTFTPSMAQDEPFVIDVPNLTLKEKAYLDERLPAVGGGESAPRENDLKLVLSDAKVAAYKRFYRYYPSFVELVG